MRNRLFFVLLLNALYFGSCHSSGTGTVDGSSDNIPEFRSELKKEPVAEYKEKVNDALNNWYFSVQVFETHKTFRYLVKMQYEEVSGEDTLTLPDFGMKPKPELQKGRDKYSCIIGFRDKEDKFHEYKLVSVSGSELKLTTLKHYSVVEIPQARSAPAP